MSLSPEALNFFADFIEKNLGIVYSKDNYYQLERRLIEIATQMNLDGPEELWRKAQGGIHGQMKMLILDIATNNETSFFRDAGLFKAIEDHIFTEERFAGDHPQALRMWCCATSTGQEVYTMAILLHNWQKANPKRNFNFLATDFSQRVLSRAQEGKYSQLEVQRGLPATMLVRFFHNETTSEASASQSPVWSVNDYLKKNITFKQLNLLDDFGGMGPFDLVMCRNVLIYQNVENKKKIIREIAKKIVSGGYFIMGAAESLVGLSDDFDQIQMERAVFYRKK